MDQKLGTYLRNCCLLLSITLALIYIAYLRTNQGEHITNPGVVISYPKSIPKNDCGSVVLTIDENQAGYHKLVNAVIVNPRASSPAPNMNIMLEATLVFPGMSVDPAGGIKKPWVDGSKQSTSWRVCSNSVGSFDGTVWIFLYAYAGQETVLDKLPVNACPIQMKVWSLFGLSKAGRLVMFVILITVLCILGFSIKNNYSNKKHS